MQLTSVDSSANHHNSQESTASGTDLLGKSDSGVVLTIFLQRAVDSSQISRVLMFAKQMPTRKYEKTGSAKLSMLR